MAQDLHLLTAGQAVEAICGGRLSSEALTSACLERIGDDPLRAWAHLDADIALIYSVDGDLQIACANESAISLPSRHLLKIKQPRRTGINSSGASFIAVQIRYHR